MKKIVARIKEGKVEILEASADAPHLDRVPAWKNWDLLRGEGYTSATLLREPNVEGYLTFWKPENELEKLELMFATYDWFYEMSDDFSVWQAGRNKDARIQQTIAVAGIQKEAGELWKQYVTAKKTSFRDEEHFLRSYLHRFSGEQK